MKIAVASGKGGTGKTLVSTNLVSVIAGGCVYLDCDVEEPNGHLFLRPEQLASTDVSILVPSIDESLCTHCGRCAAVCKFNALIDAKTKVLLFPLMCHGCGSCAYHCPEKAITEVNRKIGVVEDGVFANGRMLTGRLQVGEPMAPPIIKQLHAQVEGAPQVVLIDSPPGTSCPMIAAVKSADFVVLVTEPTPFGLHDLILAEEVIRELDLPFGVVVNKSMPGNELIEEHCRQEHIPVLLSIPYDERIARIYSRGELLVAQPEFRGMFLGLYSAIQKEVSR